MRGSACRSGPGPSGPSLAATSAGSGGADATGIREDYGQHGLDLGQRGLGRGATRWSLAGRGVSKTAARRLDSRANLQVWRERLTPEEVTRIRESTADVAGLFGYTSGNGSS